jgi:two-component system response regulator PilR (NtrC family)
VGSGAGGGAEALARRVAAKDAINLESEVMGFERRLIEAALTATADNQTEAARLLGISFRQMRYKVRQLGIR